jgi:hypothetical protein
LEAEVLEQTGHDPPLLGVARGRVREQRHRTERPDGRSDADVTGGAHAGALAGGALKLQRPVGGELDSAVVVEPEQRPPEHEQRPEPSAA